MGYVYILVSDKDGRRYIGSTVNLIQRVEQHNKGFVDSTRHRRPLRLYGWREFDTIDQAAIWEKKYKRSHGQLERDIKLGKIKMADNQGMA